MQGVAQVSGGGDPGGLPHRSWVRWARISVVAGLMLVVAACAGRESDRPGDAEYRPYKFHSSVTVTGNNVPGPLHVREGRVWIGDGGQSQKVRVGDAVEVGFAGWINGHGKMVAVWQVDGVEVDRISLFITYGESLKVILNNPTALPTGAPGSHTVRFVVEEPAPEVTWPDLVYEVVDPYP